MRGLAASVMNRVEAINEPIARVRELMEGRSVEELKADSVREAAFERYMQIISDASRGLPEDWKAGRPDVPWQEIAGLGDVISTDYDRIDLPGLWRTAETVLGPIEDTLAAATGNPAQ